MGERFVVYDESAAQHNPPPDHGHWAQSTCPDCINANRKLRRRCRSLGGMCNGTGWTWVSMTESEVERELRNRALRQRLIDNPPEMESL
jgi:hypothetical protein